MPALKGELPCLYFGGPGFVRLNNRSQSNYVSGDCLLRYLQLQIAVCEKDILDLFKKGERRLKFEIFRFLLLNGSLNYMVPSSSLLEFDVGLAHISVVVYCKLIVS